jgi:hypothetical protein
MLRASAQTPGSILRMRVHVEFDDLRGTTGEPLTLSIKYTASRVPTSHLAQLLAGLVRRRPDRVDDIDLLTLIGRPADVKLKPGPDEKARIAANGLKAPEARSRGTKGQIERAGGLRPWRGPHERAGRIV